MRPLTWANRMARRWWPFTATLVAAVVIGTMAYVVATVAEDRDHLRAQRDQLAELLDYDRRQAATREQRFEESLAAAEQLLIAHFAEHDAEVAGKLDELLERIAVLLGRPAGVPVDPVTARDVDRGESGAPRSPPPTTTPPPPTTAPPDPSPTTAPPRDEPSGLCGALPLPLLC